MATQPHPPSAGLPDTAGPAGIGGPCAIAFIASASVMIVELLAFRLIARYLGSSNYTVTSIIGVILGGLAIGNLVGGRLADRYRPGRVLAVLFILSSAGCFAVPSVNMLVGEWPALWLLTWPQRIAVHVAITFSAPAVLLGTIGPVVAKMALVRSPRIGRTVGIVYAFGALGSIVGTFACGFYLIPHFGNYAVFLGVGAVLAVMAVICDARFWLTYGWTMMATALLAIGAGPWPWARSLGADWGLRDRIEPTVLFDADSEYEHVRVEESHDVPGLRTLILDKLAHSYININQPEKLLYSYEQIYEAITDYVVGKGNGLRALVLGGGGYTYPQHILRRWPASRVEVVEIDPVVTQAAVTAFGLKADPRMDIVHLDARQRIADLVRRKKAGEPIAPFDFVFLDAVNDFNVPFHLTTRECQQMIYSLLSHDGVFLMTLIDVMDVGGFLGSTLRTVGRTFPHVEVFYAGNPGESFHSDRRYTFVVVASKKDLHLEKLTDRPGAAEVAAQRLSPDKLHELTRREQSIVLTDNHAPVEFLLAGVVAHVDRDAIRQEAALKFYNRGNSESSRGRAADAIKSYRRALELEPSMHLAQLNLGLSYAELRRFDEAMTAFRQASKIRPDLPEPLLNLGGIHMLLHDYAAAVDNYRGAIKIKPDYAEGYNSLGMALGNLGRLDDARAAFRKAIALHPEYRAARENLARLEATMRPMPTSAPKSRHQ